MTKDDYMPLTGLMAPPDSLEEAEQRVEKFTETSMTGLIGCVFLDVEQLRKALWGYGWAMPCPKVICNGGRVKTYRAAILGKDKTEYLLILNEVGLSHCQVVNCRLVEAGDDVRPEDLKAFKDTVHDGD